MANLATELIRTVSRAFYGTEHILVVDALMMHSTLQDSDLAHVLGTQVKPLRKTCGRLREDGLISVQARGERRTDGSGGYYGGAPQPGKERLTTRDWYYINYHRAIDSIKFRLHKLSKHIESQGASTTEKKDLKCLTKGCERSYTELEAMDNIDMSTGSFLCMKCGAPLEPVDEEERANENESMKRMNQQFAKLVELMQKIDATSVPENDFEAALSKYKPIEKTDAHPGTRTEIVDVPNRNLQSTKGLEIKPEKIAVELKDDEDVKRENAEADARAKKEREARQNALPEWISKSTISGDITAVGAKEERQRLEREAHTGGLTQDEEEEKKAVKGDDDVMAAYWKELELAQQKEAQLAKEEDDEDEEDEEDEFEDVEGVASTTAAIGATNGTAGTSTNGANTPANLESSNATDDERPVKRAKVADASNGHGGGTPAQDTPAASDADDDDELEFENV
ncbi:Putative transcription initiation factor IIE subunit alpha, Zinc finger, RING/FYVE/PHD-type [Septoria linicola]|uniref:Transcription initiation factor IIE subunit alpha, Zinc finger, RING/FYVE/PHD-type n=1 Tax=Septoria linicola TaxID=215465 RepID=A0A9Q9ASU1_9PEZI|nr:putative transcription initiation factor IIE subunit alpha, Zinc finger, RING/FYVE/PHD-type [Septoria linicola]USW52553.1 Putative transcription initiation factor IIE subunit alpha, Zinc finger, RING/FYVE/PHD-type [Septoria linicola]